MSEIAGTSSGVQPIARSRPTGEPKVHEAYSFTCLGCSHAWEQSYEIEHHVDTQGRRFVIYYADGKRVRSPLTAATCPNCGGHTVRIMRAGRVTSAAEALRVPASAARASAKRTAGPAEPPAEREGAVPVQTAGRAERAGSGKSAGRGEAGRAEAQHEEDRHGESKSHHWHLSDLLKPFHRK